MIRHLFVLIWNRRRANALIVVEIVACHIVLFAVVVLATYYSANYGQPLGFTYDNVWNVAIDVKQENDDTWTPEQIETSRQLLIAARSFEEVEGASGSLRAPFSMNASRGRARSPEGVFEFDRSEVTDDFATVLGLEITRGRWFGREDNGATIPPVVINERLARNLFGEADPIGQTLLDGELRVVGIVSDFRRQGEFLAMENAVIERRTLEDNGRPPRNLLLKVRPDVPADFEQRLIDRLHAVAPQWSFDVQPLSEARESMNRIAIAPLVGAALVAGFLVLMVALGLIGILWQNIARRRREIGIRRAQGATARHIFGQVLGETAALTTVSLALGSAIVGQLPFVGVVELVGAGVYAVSLAVSVVLMYLLTTVCALYPSWLATRVRPAEALHYD